MICVSFHRQKDGSVFPLHCHSLPVGSFRHGPSATNALADTKCYISNHGKGRKHRFKMKRVGSKKMELGLVTVGVIFENQNELGLFAAQEYT